MPNKPYILGIDPGPTESAYVLLNPELKPIAFEKTNNDELISNALLAIAGHRIRQFDESIDVAIEMVASYGMPVGRDVFETCVWVGRFWERLENFPKKTFVYRREEKITICHSPKANDATIRQALVDRFAHGYSNHGKGTKDNPSVFYGFKRDCWQAMAVAVTYHDKYLCKEETADDLHLEDLPF
jgi:hypothetical protein